MKIPSAVILLIIIIQVRRDRRAVFDQVMDSHEDLITQRDLITSSNLLLRKVLQTDPELTFKYLRTLFSKKFRERKERKRNKNRKEGMKKLFIKKEGAKQKL